MIRQWAGRKPQNFGAPEESWGKVIAIDPGTGNIKWEHRVLTPPWGGVMATGGNLVFGGTLEGVDFRAECHHRRSPVDFLRERAGIRVAHQLSGQRKADGVDSSRRLDRHFRPGLRTWTKERCSDKIGMVAAVWIAALTLALPLAAQSGVARTGNAAAGKAIFDGKGECGSCHSVGDRGASLGPDLGDIGVTRTPRSLRLALTDPDAEIFKEYYTVVVETKGGETIRGLALNEDDLSIQIRDINGYPRSFLKDDLKSTHREQRSLMPSYASRLSAAEIDDVVAYLRTLKGPPLPPDAKRPRQPNHAYSDVRFSQPDRPRCRRASGFPCKWPRDSTGRNRSGDRLRHRLFHLAPGGQSRTQG